MKRVLAILLLLALVGCGAKTVCNAPYILVGNSCCLDQNANGICDNDETAAAPSTTASEPATTAPSAPALVTRSLKDVQDEIGARDGYFSFEKDKVPSSHYEDTNYSVFNYYGSTNFDALEIKDPSNYFTDFDGFKTLMQAYIDERAAKTGPWLEEQLLPQNKTFLLYTNLTEITLRTGDKALEFRNRAAIIVHGTAITDGHPYSDWINPWGMVTIYLPCGPNLIISFFGVNDGISKFAGNYEGDAYVKEMESSIDQISQQAQYRAEKVASYCAKMPK